MRKKTTLTLCDDHFLFHYNNKGKFQNLVYKNKGRQEMNFEAFNLC